MARTSGQKSEQKTPTATGGRSLTASIDSVIRRIQTVQERGRKNHPFASDGIRIALEEAGGKINTGLDAMRQLAGAADDMATLCALVERQQKRRAVEPAETDSVTSGPETGDAAASAPGTQASAVTTLETPQPARQQSPE